jgi:hypothetical protein
MDKPNVVHTHSGILFSLKKNILAHGTTWMNLEKILLSEVSHSQKGKCFRLLLQGYVEKSNSQRLQVDQRLPGTGGRRGGGEAVFNKYRVLVGKMTKVLEMMVVMVAH